ncbi:MAG TPA: dienelactone hydrolase family protein [Alphaproteobacteria bacterium]|nr:dienelactone hydrolase family protein [Alphaproteobacteria bacterium]
MSQQDIQTSMVDFQSDGVSIAAFLARPSGTGRYPAVLVLQEWWGLNTHIKDIATRFAREGYVALAPDLYSRQGNKVTTDPTEAGTLMGGLQDDLVLTDLRAAVAYLKNQPQVNAAKLGVIGFCMGGTYALLAAENIPDIRASVPFYGQIVYEQPGGPIDQVERLGCPLMYIYGDADGWITPDHVDRLEAALKQHHKNGQVVRYRGAPHAFFNDTRPDTYRPDDARDAWDRTLKFFAQHLKG